LADAKIFSPPFLTDRLPVPISRFSIEQQLIRIELNQILEASGLVEATIRRHLSEIDAQWATIEEGWSDEDRAAYEDKLAYDVFQIRDVFGQVLRRSLFLSAYAYLEQGLDTICTRLQQERGYTVSLTDINGRGISRSKTYLSKVAGVAFPDQGPIWMRVKAYADLRNYLTHSGPLLDRGDASDQLIKKLSGLNHLDLIEEVNIEPRFLDQVISDLQILFDEVYNALKFLPPVSV
jgi:hypothetical protein